MRLQLVTALLFLSLAVGCQTTSPYQQPYPGYLPTEYGAPPMASPQPVGTNQMGGRVMGAVGNFAGGFARSVAGGAGFSAGRDLWDAIAR